MTLARSVAQSIAYGVAPFWFFQEAKRRRGTPFTVHVFGETWVVQDDPAVVRELFTGSPRDLNSGEANAALASVVGNRNVLLLDGDEHLARRKVVLPPFHGERMRAYEQIVRERAREELARWPAREPGPALDRMRAITFDVILRAVFGADERNIARLRTVLTELLDFAFGQPRGAILFALGPERTRAYPPFRRRLRAVEDEVAALIASRRAEPGEDVLSLLLAGGLSGVEVRDELLTLLIAGHETTAALLAWALHELARAPEEWERVAGEGAEPAVRETLRLYPPVPLVVRRLTRELEVGGRTYPAGTTLAPCAVLVHRDPGLWPDPEAFRPARFADGAPPPGSAYFPFGGGVRRCIGAAFASFEARIVLEEMARAVTLLPAFPRPEGVGRRGVVLVPAKGGRLLVVPRGGYRIKTSPEAR